MKSSSAALVIAAALLHSGFARAAPAPSEAQTTSKRSTRPKVIIDNDFAGTTSWPPTMLFLGAGYDVLGLTVVVGNSWVNSETTHILRFLEAHLINIMGISKELTPSDVNLDNREQTADALGGDPTSGDPFRITPIPEGLPTWLKAQEQNAVQFMIDQVHKYQGEVEIYVAGGATNVALAIRTDPEFASLTKRIVYQGGYVSTNLFQTDPTPSYSVYINEDVGADFNTFIDPEAAKIMLNADFPEILISGQVANNVFLTSDMIADVLKVNTTVTTQLVAPYWSEAVGTPLWDELAAGVMAYPELITVNRTVYIDVDTAWGGPHYGRSFVAVEGYQPAGTRNVTFITGVDEAKFKSLLVKAVQGVY
ncbi:hypothetical protein RQP46_007995 [Phenoliferia psychrophenolica]